MTDVETGTRGKFYDDMLKAFRHGRKYKGGNVAMSSDLAEKTPDHELPFAEWFNRFYANPTKHVEKGGGRMRSMYRPARFKKLRGFARPLWSRHFRSIQWLYRFAFPCEHTHTFSANLPANTPWFFKGKRSGEHSGLAIEGCYLCGKIRARNLEE